MSQLHYLLDTTICIYIINRRPLVAFDHFDGMLAGEVGISGITAAELDFGIVKSGSKRNRVALDKFLAPLDILPFNEDAVRYYGKLRTSLEADGVPIGVMDMLIASHALALDATLVTNNLREFERVGGLRLENWT
jgi:tRNA(fMet)-specific endonuclease VapC